MTSAMRRGATFALYQVTVALGILLMPVALLARRIGVTLPVNRLLDAANAAYEAADEPTP
jgi:hypothetical protein